MAEKGNRVKFTQYYEPRQQYALIPIENGEGIHDGTLYKARENKNPYAPETVAIVLLDAGGMLMVPPEDITVIG